MSKTILDGPTITVTSGTSALFVTSPDSNTDKTRWIDSTEADYELRRSIFASNRPARSDGKGGYVQQKAQLSMTVPRKDAETGEIRYASVRAEISVDPRDAAALMDALRETGVQLFIGTDWDNLYEFGNLD